MAASTEKKSHTSLGEKAWLTALQNGSNSNHNSQRGQGLGSVVGHYLRPIIPSKNTVTRKTVQKRRKKAVPKQKGRGLGIRPRKQMRKISGPPKTIKRMSATTKKTRKRKKSSKNFGLFD